MYTTKLNKNTKKAQAFINAYFGSHYFSVRDCYNNRVYTKESIEDAIRRKMSENGMTDYRVLSYNTFHFTCGYMDKTENILYVETQANIFEIDLRD